jgi:hypothetical protein
MEIDYASLDSTKCFLIISDWESLHDVQGESGAWLVGATDIGVSPLIQAGIELKMPS